MLRRDRLHIHNAVTYSSHVQCKKDINMHWTKDLSFRSVSCWYKQITLASCMTSVDGCGSGFVVLYLYLCSLALARLLEHLFKNQGMPISHSFKSRWLRFNRKTKWKCGRLPKRTAVFPTNRSFNSTEYSYISAQELCHTRYWEERHFVDTE